ncbi:MFS transporter [Marinicrinis lubricantis]|uniref:MFS transporter n=1 Tax=Marinicrinis lubricantis TaxID=2086470 RepID=A0ABW1IJI4_9BACL
MLLQRTKSRPAHIKLSQQAVTSLWIHCAFQFGSAMSMVFVNLYLWRLTEDLALNGAYTLISLLVAPLATIWIGKVAKQKDRLMAYRSGIFLTAIFYLGILIVQEQIVKYFIVFALLKGISTAFYWLGYFTLMYDVSNDENRHRYLGLNTIVTNLAMLGGPAAAGWIISRSSELSGYVTVFLLSFVMYALATLGSFKMTKAEDHHRKYYLNYLPMMLRKNTYFLKTLLGWLIVGLPQGILLYLPQIILFQVFPDESFVGYMNVCFMAISVVVSYVLSRTASVAKTGLYLWIAGAGLLVSSSVLLWQVALWSVITFMCIQSLFKPVQANAYTAHYYRWIGMLPLKRHFRIESIVLRESVINAGRAIGVIVFMVCSTDLDTPLLPWILFAVMLAQLLVPWLVQHEPIEEEDSK